MYVCPRYNTVDEVNFARVLDCYCRNKVRKGNGNPTGWRRVGSLLQDLIILFGFVRHTVRNSTTGDNWFLLLHLFLYIFSYGEWRVPGFSSAQVRHLFVDAKLRRGNLSASTDVREIASSMTWDLHPNRKRPASTKYVLFRVDGVDFFVRTMGGCRCIQQQMHTAGCGH